MLMQKDHTTAQGVEKVYLPLIVYIGTVVK